jgi:hypothetical protein
VGFFDLFAEASGREEIGPYVKVKPTCIGGVLIPFQCPFCGTVQRTAVDKKKWTDYADERGFSWCPSCRKRYVLDGKGAPPAEEIAVGATHAPAIVELGGKVAVIGGRKHTNGLKLLGA